MAVTAADRRGLLEDLARQDLTGRLDLDQAVFLNAIRGLAPLLADALDYVVLHRWCDLLELVWIADQPRTDPVDERTARLLLDVALLELIPGPLPTTDTLKEVL